MFVSCRNVPATAQAYVAGKATANGVQTKPKWGSSEQCPRCHANVYMAEKVMGAGQVI